MGRLHGCAFQLSKSFLLHSTLGTPRSPSTRPQCTPPAARHPAIRSSGALRSRTHRYIALSLHISLQQSNLTQLLLRFPPPNPSQVTHTVLTLSRSVERVVSSTRVDLFSRKDIFAETMASMTTLASLPAVHTGLRTDVEKSFASSSSSQSLLAQRSAVSKSSRSVVTRASHGQEEGQGWKVAKSAAAAAAISLVLNASPAQAADPNAFLSFPDNAAGEAVSFPRTHDHLSLIHLSYAVFN